MSHGDSFQKGPARIPSVEEKQRLYREACLTLKGLLENETEATLVMSSIVAVLHHTMPYYFWTGFYRVVGDELCVGPYQGTPACLKIARGRGVCGEAWEKGEAIVVADVHQHPGHIACDARSASEIVIPWKTKNGAVRAVLDIDSTLPAAFDEVDRHGLLEIMECFAAE